MKEKKTFCQNLKSASPKKNRQRRRNEQQHHNNNTFEVVSSTTINIHDSNNSSISLPTVVNNPIHNVNNNDTASYISMDGTDNSQIIEQDQITNTSLEEDPLKIKLRESIQGYLALMKLCWSQVNKNCFFIIFF